MESVTADYLHATSNVAERDLRTYKTVGEAQREALFLGASFSSRKQNNPKPKTNKKKPKQTKPPHTKEPTTKQKPQTQPTNQAKRNKKKPKPAKQKFTIVLCAQVNTLYYVTSF